jgi:predicted RNA binding protein YcfA (HicA-like mRNA interferase family)
VSPSLPVVTARQIIRVAEKLGFAFDRQRGSHAVYYRESDGRRVVIPVHQGKDIRVGLLRSLIRDMGITPAEFVRYL